MKSPRFWIAVLVAGIVGNALDAYVQGHVLTNAYFSKIDSMRHDTSPAWFIIGDFVAVFVLAWVFDRVASVFGAGAKGGACAGFALGVLANFPMWHMISFMVKGIPYALVWIETLYGIGWYVLLGAIMGAMMKKAAPAA